MTNDQQTTIGPALPRRQTKLLFCLYILMTAVGVHSLLFVDPVVVTLAGVTLPAVAFYTTVALAGTVYFGVKLLFDSENP